MLSSEVAQRGPVNRLPDIPSINGKDVIDMLARMWGDIPQNKEPMIEVLDIVEYLDTYWEKGAGLLREWMTQYVHTVADPIVNRVSFRSEYDREETIRMIRDPRDYFHVTDGDSVRYRAMTMLFEKGVPLREDKSVCYVFAALLHLSCGDYRRAHAALDGAFVLMAVSERNPPDRVVQLSVFHSEFFETMCGALCLQANILADIIRHRGNTV